MVATLWEARLTDLQLLRELRFFDSAMTDYRHRWLYLSGVALSWLASSPRAMQRELYELAREAGSLGGGRKGPAVSYGKGTHGIS